MQDVVVIGGGPAGSRAAFRLAEAGHSVLVIERKARPGGKTACTGIVGRECAEAFNIDDKVILRRVNSASLFSPSGKRLHVYREGVQACILDRAAFDVMMAERAQNAGAEYRFESRATNVSIAPDRASVAVSCRGQEETIDSRAVVVAGGFAPGLHRRLGLGAFRDHTFGAQAEVEITDLNEVEVYFGNIAPGFFAWLVPVSPGIARAGLLARQNPGACLRKWLEQMRNSGRISSADAKISYGAIPLQPPARTCGERIIAVGDAAGQVKPLSGGGIYYGLLGADTAADTLHRALAEDDLSAPSLAQYEKAWRDRLGKEIRNGYRARKLFERLSDKGIDRLFRAAGSCGIEAAIARAPGVSFDWHGRTLRKLLSYRAGRPLQILKMPSTRR
jgi:digeranylgeranylglycerophospholipid reductase